MNNLRKARTQVGHSPVSNCWGMTAFLLGWRQRLLFMPENLMQSRLRRRLRRIGKPKRFRVGDVAAKWDRECPTLLLHTAVYIGRGKWLHQIGYRGQVRLHNYQAMIRSYAGAISFHRA